jgi:hypothetical protein
MVYFQKLLSSQLAPLQQGGGAAGHGIHHRKQARAAGVLQARGHSRAVQVDPIKPPAETDWNLALETEV